MSIFYSLISSFLNLEFVIDFSAILRITDINVINGQEEK